jgi:hypothetical protein
MVDDDNLENATEPITEIEEGGIVHIVHVANTVDAHWGLCVGHFRTEVEGSVDTAGFHLLQTYQQKRNRAIGFPRISSRMDSSFV